LVASSMRATTDASHAMTAPCCFVERKESAHVTSSTNRATIGLAGMALFEVALAAGARLGDAAWGGTHPQPVLAVLYVIVARAPTGHPAPTPQGPRAPKAQRSENPVAAPAD
jgi:hypothetical protein